MYLFIYICVCVRVYIYIYLFMCVCILYVHYPTCVRAHPQQPAAHVVLAALLLCPGWAEQGAWVAALSDQWSSQGDKSPIGSLNCVVGAMAAMGPAAVVWLLQGHNHMENM